MSHDEQLPPPARMMQLITGFWTSCCIYAAAKLNIAALLAEGPMTAARLAEATRTHEPSLFRLMRALAGAGIFKSEPGGAFSLTPLGQTLRPDVPGSMQAMAIAQLGDHFPAWGNLLFSVRTGKTAFDEVQGMPVWKYYEAHPEDGLNFMKAMAGLTQAVIMNVVPAYDWSGLKAIVDVGGGNGALLSAVLKAAPGTRGIVFDEDYVVKETRRRLEAEGLGERCGVAAGSFFESVPEGGDAYLLKMILHDWDDANAARILGKIKQAMRPEGRVLVMESVIPEDDSPHPGKFMDLNMLAMTGGRERTEREFSALFAQAGLRLRRVIPTHSPLFSVVEAVKA